MHHLDRRGNRFPSPGRNRELPAGELRHYATHALGRRQQTVAHRLDQRARASRRLGQQARQLVLDPRFQGGRRLKRLNVAGASGVQSQRVRHAMRQGVIRGSRNGLFRQQVRTERTESAIALVYAQTTSIDHAAANVAARREVAYPAPQHPDQRSTSGMAEIAKRKSEHIDIVLDSVVGTVTASASVLGQAGRTGL